MSARIWSFVSGTRTKADPQKAGEQFERLEAQGRLTAEEVVNENRPEDAPLHNAFEWNDAVAGEMYRRGQARTLIASIRVVSVDEPEPKRVYFNVEAASPVYESVSSILRSETKQEKLLQNALKELISWQRRYKEVNELLGVSRAIDEARRQYSIPGVRPVVSARATM